MDLGRSYLEVQLRLNSASTDGIVADDNEASDSTNTRLVYVQWYWMSTQMNTNTYSAFLETLLNYNQDEGEALLAPQGWLKYGSPHNCRTK